MANQKTKSLALFDFDGTITSKDSFLEFLKFTTSTPELLFGAITLIPTLVKYKLSLLTNRQAKEKVFAYFFVNWETNRFKTIAKEFSHTILPKIIKQSAAEKITWHKEQGHDIVIVSASFELYLQPWCKKEKVDLLGTNLEEKEGNITGKFSSKNCHGQEKVRRIKEKYNLNYIDQIYAYGDSSGDKEMLQLADKPHFRFFK